MIKNAEQKIRKIQYYSLLSMENVCFDDREYYTSKGKYLACCWLLDELPSKYTLDELEKFPFPTANKKVIEAILLKHKELSCH